MSTVGQIEKRTQQRVIKLFQAIGYTYLGDWHERGGNANVEPGLLRAFLVKQGYDDALITRALHVVQR